MWREDKVTYEILEHLGEVSEKGKMKLEVNIVSWNDNPPKVDIRPWNEDHTEMRRGITLTEEEAKRVYLLLKGRYDK